MRSAPGFRRPVEVGAIEQRRPLVNEAAEMPKVAIFVRVPRTNSFDAAIDNRGRQQRLAEDLEVFRVSGAGPGIGDGKQRNTGPSRPSDHLSDPRSDDVFLRPVSDGADHVRLQPDAAQEEAGEKDDGAFAAGVDRTRPLTHGVVGLKVAVGLPRNGATYQLEVGDGAELRGREDRFARHPEALGRVSRFEDPRQSSVLEIDRAAAALPPQRLGRHDRCQDAMRGVAERAKARSQLHIKREYSSPVLRESGGGAILAREVSYRNWMNAQAARVGCSLLRCGRRPRASRVTHARPNDTSGDRKLPYVTHRVFCTMHEASDDGRRELGPPHAAKVAQCRDIDRAKLRNGCVNSCGERAQNGRDVRREQFLTFRLNRCELL